MRKTGRLLLLTASLMLAISVPWAAYANKAHPSAESVPVREQSLPANVDNINVPPSALKSSLVPSAEAVPAPLTLDSKNSLHDITLFGLTPPTQFWSLTADNPNNGSFSYVYNTIHTNYYFPVNSSNELYVSYYAYNDASEQPKGDAYKIILFDFVTESEATHWPAVTGTSGKVRFYNLDPNRTYYVGFQNVGRSTEISGNFTVSHQ